MAAGAHRRVDDGEDGVGADEQQFDAVLVEQRNQLGVVSGYDILCSRREY
jgi:hypothetical protein